MTGFIHDLRYAFRQLGKSPGFATTAILTLALGIGATTAIFTLVYDVMLRPLPYAQADRLVTVEEIATEWRDIYPSLPVSANHFTFWQEHNRSSDAMALMLQDSMPLGSEGNPSEVGVVFATPGIFSVLQAQPHLGRSFTVSEAQPGSEHVAVLLYSMWRDQFGGDPNVVGKTIRLMGAPFTVIGVMPRYFRLPSVLQPFAASGASGDTQRPLPTGVLVPLSFSRERLAEPMGDLNYFGLARLKAGVSLTAATADLDALQHTISVNLPSNDKATLSAKLTPFQEALLGNGRKPLLLLLAAVAGLLIVGCVNVANLLLARAVGQKQKVAIAAALGAGRAELVRMTLRETVLLAAMGGSLGILLASGIVPVMQRYLPPALDFRGSLHLDWAGAGCALILALLTTLLAGVAPTWVASRTSPNEVLRSESRLASEPRGSRRARRVLVGCEVAVSLALLLITALLTTSMIKLMRVDRGFTAENTITAMIDLPTEPYRDGKLRAAFYREILEHMDRLPGVERVAITSMLPLTGDSWGDFARVTGDPRPETQLPLESFRWVSPAYFSTIRLELRAGQFFSASDWGRNLALVSEKTAKALWPGKNPVGQQFTRGDPAKEKPFTVIGVVANARTVSLAKPDPMLIYVPYWYRCDRAAGLVLRTHRGLAETADAIRRTIWSVDRNVPVPEVRLLSGVVADSVATQRFEMNLLLLFAISALLLAGLGVYGVITYSVVQRSREIGLRIALGAQPASIYRLVLRDGLIPVGAGVAAGVAVAFGFARFVSTLLFQVSPYDPVLTIETVCALIAIGTAACLLPARRAAKVDPMVALRYE